MFRRRQPALIASIATAASLGLVVPVVATGVHAKGASAVSQAAAARGVAPAVGSVAVAADAMISLAALAGEAPAGGEADPAAEPASEPTESTTTTTEPDEDPAGDPSAEAAATTTSPSTTVPTESTTTTTAPGEESVGEPSADATTTTTSPSTTVPTESTTTTTPEAAEPTCEPTDEPAPTTTTTTTATTETTTPVDGEQPACEPSVDPGAPTTTTTTPPTTTTTTTTAPADASEAAPASEPTEAATDTTVPTTVPAPVDEPVEGEPDENISPSDDEPADVATVDEPAQRVESADEQGDGEPPAAVDQPVAPETPVDTTPAEINTYDPGLRASSYDGVYAEGVPVGVAMATTRWLESGNRYDAQARGSTASGAYQVINSTWNGYAGYARAVLAPPEVQDQFAYESFTALLKRHGNDVSKIPVSWYIGHVPQGAEWDTVPHPEAGNTLTPRQYQAKWMKKFFSLLSEGAPVYLPSDTEALVPAIAFPVLGPVEFVDDWHFERDGGARRHEGLDLLGYEGQPIRAVFDGVITMIDDDPSGIAGNGLRLTRDDGLYANYFHLSNSETGPVHSSLEVGTRVRAGQIIGFMGTTGNAGIPHLHFELRTPEREPMAPYPAMLEAIQREQCTVGLGPWSTEFMSPAAQAEAEAEAMKALAGLTDEQIEGLAHLPEAPAEEVEYLTIEGPDGARWVIGDDGSVTATGQAAMIGSYQADCPMPIDTVDDNGDPIVFGTDADGLAVDELPIGWWDDEAVEWKPDLEAEETYVDPWELDQADLDASDEHHVDHDDDRALVDRRHLRMI